METLTKALVLSAIRFLSPEDKVTRQPQLPGWEETAEQRLARYDEIASDITKVALDPANQPIFNGPFARERSALMLTTLGFMEGGFAHDVDDGDCYRKSKKFEQRCDHGRSHSIYQIMIERGKTTKEGFTADEIRTDRVKATTVALNIARDSFKACVPVVGYDGALMMYASGSCARGMSESKDRMAVYEKLRAKFMTDYEKKVRAMDSYRFMSIVGENGRVSPCVFTNSGTLRGAWITTCPTSPKSTSPLPTS